MRLNLTPVSPRTTEFMRWASDLTEQLAGYNAPSPSGEASWVAWAETIAAIPAVAELGAPAPRQFASWVDWAERLLQAAD